MVLDIYKNPFFILKAKLTDNNERIIELTNKMSNNNIINNVKEEL